MDLFGRKARKEAERLQVLLDGAISLWQQEKQRAATLDKEYSVFRVEVERERQFAVDELATRSQATTFRSEPMYMNESEEDIDYMLKNELIDKKMAEDMLAQLAFDNAEITLDYESTDRSSISY